MQLEIDNDRWRNVPVFLLTGKALDEKKTELRITFKPNDDEQTRNTLVFHIQPNEGVKLEIQMKKPGFGYETQAVDLDVNFAQAFNNHGHPDAYERVLVDAVRGDQTLFATSDEVLAAWSIVDPLIWGWANDAAPLEIYKAGSSGPTLPNQSQSQP